MSDAVGGALEIERRFLILIPSDAVLRRYGARCRRIVQTYLVTPEGYSSERVRKSESGGKVTLTHTRKMRIARETAIEEEREISPSEYEALLLRADPMRRPIEKCRYTFLAGGLCYEIDLSPEWKRAAVMEVELADADAELEIPEGIRVLSEVTGEKRYSNHALALAFPPEPIF